MEGTEPTDEKKVPIAQKLDDIENAVEEAKRELLERLDKGFSELKKILTDVEW